MCGSGGHRLLNKEVAKATDETRRLFRMWIKSKTETNRALYCSAKRKARREVYLAKSDEQKVFGGMLDEEFEKGTVLSCHEAVTKLYFDDK
jgi:hypothetical protein